MYSKDEIKEIRDLLTGKRILSKNELKTVKDELKNTNDYSYPFIGLSATNPSLYKEVLEDENIKTFSAFGFFPETFDLVYHSSTQPIIYYRKGKNRGLIAFILHPEKNLVIKQLQNSREHETAMIAAGLGVGPEQYETLDQFLTEQLIEGHFFTGLDEDQKSNDGMCEIGRQTGEILSLLHSKDIFYNDTILSDDFGRSHLIVPESSPAMLIDYGVALNLGKHPDISDEDVFNYARTIPLNNFILHMNASKEKINELIQNHRPEIQKMSKKEIMSRDVSMINEGLGFARYRPELNNNILKLFIAGFKETYQQ
ncbi:MAG: hypothetical protein U9P44_00205 [archaeon]|nr:hypothetical protein [archaeon]